MVTCEDRRSSGSGASRSGSQRLLKARVSARRRGRVSIAPIGSRRCSSSLQVSTKYDCTSKTRAFLSANTAARRRDPCTSQPNHSASSILRHVVSVMNRDFSYPLASQHPIGDITAISWEVYGRPKIRYGIVHPCLCRLASIASRLYLQDAADDIIEYAMDEEQWHMYVLVCL